MKKLIAGFAFIVFAFATGIITAKPYLRTQPLTVRHYSAPVEFEQQATALGLTVHRTDFNCLDAGTTGPLAFTKGGNAITITGDFVVELLGKTKFLVPTANCLSDDVAPVTTTFGTAVDGVMFSHTPGATVCCRNDFSPSSEFCSPPNPDAVSTGFATEAIQSCTILFGSMSSVSFFVVP